MRQCLGLRSALCHQFKHFWVLPPNTSSSVQVVEQALTMVKTMYRQPMPPPAQANGQAHGMAPMTEAEISGLRRRRWNAHLKAQAWESKCIGLEDQSAHYIALEDDDLSRCAEPSRRTNATQMLACRSCQMQCHHLAPISSPSPPH